jgi:hypothetical protein
MPDPINYFDVALWVPVVALLLLALVVIHLWLERPRR